MTQIIRIATRKSLLALWQANFIADLLTQYHPDKKFELVAMSTSGDNFLKSKLQPIGGKGAFVKELEEALLDKRADLAVHSMKDVPVTLPDGLMIAAMYQRGSPFDALVSNTGISLDDLPQGSRIGTVSLRRQSQLLAYRPDLNLSALRGNIHSRIQRLKQGEFDAIMLAAAGLERMTIDPQTYQIIGDDIMLPACGQGALGIECRSDDLSILELLQPINDQLTTLCVEAERYVNQRLGGNCHVPLAVFCQPDPNNLEHITLRAKVLAENGSVVLNAHHQGALNDSESIAEQCVKTLLDQGAAKLLGLEQ